MVLNYVHRIGWYRIKSDEFGCLILDLVDEFQRFKLNNAFSFVNCLQQHRQRKEFNATFVKLA